MGARKYNPLILSYCRANGIEVPLPFERHPASRFAVVRLDCSPPKLSAKTFFKKEDLHYYIRSNMKELGLTDGTALPLRILDFADHVYLTVDPDGRTRPGLSFSEPGPAQGDAS
jgi:hypothetical protein